jgi:hypothetical protein
MKKNLKKLRLHRDTLAILDPREVSPLRGGAAAAIVTSCTYPCNCEPGCSAEEVCIGTTAACLA